MKNKLSIILLSFTFLFSGVNVSASVTCKANQTLPDPICSPGVVLTTDVKTICTSGYTKTVRDVSEATKKKVFKEYGISYSLHSNYEVDHIISLELGGSNDIKNLYPESYLINNGAKVKDKLENYLHKQVCNGSMTIQEAQKEISTNWLKYYNQYFGQKTTTVNSSPSIVQPVTATGPAVKKSSSGICHERGTTYYDQTTNFTSFTSLQACLNGGGRLPKK